MMSNPVHACLVGHLTEAQLKARLAEIAAQVDEHTRPAVVLDCSSMTSYELTSRKLFVDWNAEHRDKIRGLAIVVTKPLWFAVVATMSMVSRQTMRAFRTLPEAEQWAAQLEDPKSRSA
jgi:hypothetical protein